MKTSFILTAHPYGKRLLVAIGISKEELLKEVKKYKLRSGIYKMIKEEKHIPFKHNTAMTYYDTNYANAVIYLNKFEFKPKWISILSHEINHFGVVIMQNVGVNIMKEDEPFYYTTEELLEKILKRFK